MRISITGHDGRLGTALCKRLGDHHELNHLQGDIREYETVLAQYRAFAPQVVIHTAALTNVDYCALHPEEALAVNGYGAQNVAHAAQQVGATLVHVSTNEVFSGAADSPYHEYDHRAPANPYGYSKYVGERVVEQSGVRFMMVRTAWLFAPGGTNFIHKILARAREGQPLKVVTDEIGSPTYVKDLAEAIAALIEADRPGTYHMVNSGVCSRWEFAREILDRSGMHETPIERITSDAFERPSTPPPYSPLANVFGALLGVTMRPWQEALAEYLDEYA